MNVIGVSAGYHDSAACLLQEGRLVGAVQEERFSRVKNDKSFPRRAIRFCLERGGMSIADVDCIAYYEDPGLKLERQAWMAMRPGISATRRASIVQRFASPTPQEQIRFILGYEGRVHLVDHHLSHAASSYYFSGFDEAAILTADGVGDWPTTTYSHARNMRIDRFEEVRFPHSLGLLYSAITSYLGFEVNEGEYKVMGLAPYGKPTMRAEIEKLVQVDPDGQFRLELAYFDFLDRDAMFTDELPRLLGQPPRAPGTPLTEFHADVARSMQAVLEDILLQKVRYLHARTQADNLCMAGGVALNVVANSRCLRDGPFKRLFVQPAAGDAGSCIGAAAAAHVALTGTKPSADLAGMFLGPRNEGTFELLEDSSAKFSDFRGNEYGLLDATVTHLVQGKVVAWSQGAMEFGPRALGARSFLADPRRPEMRDRVNAMIKMREGFRPFAPAVLARHAAAHFDIDHDSPYMLEVCQVKSALELPAVTHVDGSARLQTVHEATHARFAALLEAFHARTGCPALLNTSFNTQGEPIVCSPFDAIMCFVRSKADVLVLEDFVLERSGVPLTWEVEANQSLRGRRSDASPSHLVYTLV